MEERSEGGDRLKPVQIPTGVPGLDRLLGGGLRQGALHVVVGGPGMGKSVLAHQIGAEMIRAGGKVLYLTALVETHQTLVSQARTFRFFDPAVVPGAFYYASLYPALEAGGLKAAREEITRLVAQHAPTLVIVDGVHALSVSASSRLEYQRFMHEMEAQAAVAGMTTLLLAHPPEGGLETDPTFTIADGILLVGVQEVRLRHIRTITVTKLRGVAHLGGTHTFRITSDGVRIFPRVEALTSHMTARTRHGDGQGADTRTTSVMIGGLDEMVGGGLERGSATVVVGTPGSGKTLFGLSFLCGGMDDDEPGLLVSYHEAPEALMQKADGVGLPLRRAVEEGRVFITWRAPTEMLVDEEIERLLELVEEHGIRRVVIDALEDLRSATYPPGRDVVVLTSLANLLRERGISTVLLQDLQRVIGVNFDMPMAELSAMMDNVIHLRFVEQKGMLTRLIAILKIRWRGHDHSLRELVISPEGLAVGKAFDRSEMVLTGFGLPR